jgi:hypothetical protein
MRIALYLIALHGIDQRVGYYHARTHMLSEYLRGWGALTAHPEPPSSLLQVLGLAHPNQCDTSIHRGAASLGAMGRTQIWSYLPAYPRAILRSTAESSSISRGRGERGAPVPVPTGLDKTHIYR